MGKRLKIVNIFIMNFYFHFYKLLINNKYKVSDIFNIVKKILYEDFSFHFEQIQLDTKLELELGIDSREMLELMSRLEDIFDIEIPDGDVDQLIEDNLALTLQDLITYIKRRRDF